MDLQKVRNLSDGGRFDLACECTPKDVRKKYPESSLEQAALKGIYTSHITDGKTVRIFKTLMTDSCTHDCNYCTNSTNCKNSKKKHMYKPEELAKVFMHLVKHNDIHGLFLSSGIIKDADHTTEKMLECVKIIRNRYKFHGYIHFKALPGVSYSLLKEARNYASRMSINIETTGTQRINEFTSIKTFKSDIIKRQHWIKTLQPNNGQTTQIVVGAAGESDKEVLSTMKWEYDNIELKRMYYSAFTPLHHTPFENKDKAPQWRANRLYNVDWLYRIYGYQMKELKEILVDDFLPNQDPKIAHAKIFLDNPVDINTASQKELIKVPGIGPKTARNIIIRRKERTLKRQHLHQAGAIMKRADPFIRVDGWTQKTLV
ncbi:radical SAM protein [Thermoproteota archaeon]